MRARFSYLVDRSQSNGHVPACQRCEWRACRVRSAGWESTLDPGPLGVTKPSLGLDAQAEHMVLAVPAARDIGPVFASRNELFLASVSTFAVVAGQTQIHVRQARERQCQESASDGAATVHGLPIAAPVVI